MFAGFVFCMYAVLGGKYEMRKKNVENLMFK